MKLISGLLILVGTCAAMIQTHSTTNTVAHSFISNILRAQLRLTTSVLEQRSCSPDHFGLKLRLTIKNIGNQSVILHKENAISRIMVSGDLAAAKKKKYEQDLRYDDPGAGIGLESPFFSDFTILKPEEIIEFEEPVSVYLFNAKRRAEQFLREGTHFLQVDVGSWPYIANPASFRRDWKDKGYLWFEGITSEPIPFTINKDRQIIECH